MAPMEFLNSREGRASRTFVRNKLDTGHDHVTESLVDENGKPAEPTGLLAAIRQLLYKWDAYNPHAWVDYQISVVAVVLQNIATAVLWTLIHILTNPALKAEVIKEVNSILEPRDGDEQSSGSFVIDASKFRESCPHLAATWYEMLRWNGAVPVARYVTDDTVFASQYTLKKGGIMVSPMAVRHFDPEIWGADPHEFRAERLLREDGKLNMDLIRQLGTFGIPGVGVCPGRYLAFNVAMSMLAKILISFDITYPEGGLLARGQVPKPKTHLSLGMSEPEQDAEAVLKRRVGIAAVKVDFENIKPGW